MADVKNTAPLDEKPVGFAYPETENAVIYETQHITPFVGCRGKIMTAISQLGVSGIAYVPVSANTKVFVGFQPGCMLAYLATATGGVAAGTVVQFDPLSTDTGQKVWNGMVIIDLGMVQFPALFAQTVAGATAVAQSYTGVINVSTPKSAWMLRKQFLYCGTSPAVDSSTTIAGGTAVNTALTTLGAYQTVISVGSSTTTAPTTGSGTSNVGGWINPNGVEAVVVY